MFPTSSRTFLVGRNARSATARITLVCPPRDLRRRNAASRDKPTRTASAKTKSEPLPESLRSARRTAAGTRPPVVCSAAVSGRRTRSCAIVAGDRGDAGAGRLRQAGPSRTPASRAATSPFESRSAAFPAVQRLAQHTHLVISVRNAGTRRSPNIAVTITDPPVRHAQRRRSAAASRSPGLASRSRPMWIIDRPPGPCAYSCRTGGPGGAVTAYSNTWALGALAPGQTATFDWGVTAVKAGTLRRRVPGRRRAERQGEGACWQSGASPTRHVHGQGHAAAPAVLRQQQRSDRHGPVDGRRPYELLDCSQMLIPPSTA